MSTQTIGGRNWRPSDTLPNRLVLVRAERGLSQKSAALACGVTARVWQGLEEGRSARDERAILKKISENLDVDLGWLAFGGELAAENPRPDGGPDGGNEVVRPKGFEPLTSCSVLTFPLTCDDADLATAA